MTINLQSNPSALTAEGLLHSIFIVRLTSDLRMDYLYSLETDPQKTSVSQQWIYANHIENTSSSIVVLTVCCIATEAIRVLPAYSLLGECVYRVVAQQRVYMSQYKRNIYSSDH
jgi:hypothetical protein